MRQLYSPVYSTFAHTAAPEEAPQPVPPKNNTDSLSNAKINSFHLIKQSGIEQKYWHEYQHFSCDNDIFQTLNSNGIMEIPIFFKVGKKRKNKIKF